MKISIQPKYTKSGKMMTRVEITLFVDEGEEKRIDNFLRKAKARGSLTISGLSPITGKNLAVDIRP